jgi:hypothetical protein
MYKMRSPAPNTEKETMNDQDKSKEQLIQELTQVSSEGLA